jgi:hypothetical protein
MAMYSKEAVRRAYVIDRLIVSHTGFKTVLASFDRSFQLSKEFNVPAGLRVIGPPGSGKSTVIDYFCESLPKFDLIEPGMGAITIEMPKTPKLGGVIQAVLSAVEYPFPSVAKETLDIKRSLSVKALQRKGTRILSVDEAHNLFPASGAHLDGQGTPITSYLRHVADHAKASICLIGGPLLARLESLDTYLASRCRTTAELMDFPLGGEWLGLIKAFIKQCGTFDLQFLDEVEQRRLLFQAVKGNLRALKALLLEAILIAVDAGQLQLDKGCMAIAFQRVNGLTAMASNPWGK